MPMMASVPKMMARGRFRRGSLTSPPANDTSAKPSYAQRMLTSAKPMLPALTAEPADDWKWPSEPPCAPPNVNAQPASTASAENFAAVGQPTMAAPMFAPEMFATAAPAIAAAASVLAANGCAAGSTPKVLSPYSPNTIDMPPRALARMSTSSDQPNRNAIGRPQPSRKYA